MTKFDKSKFSGSEYVTYEGKFVSRFKRGGKADFIKFLINNFSVEEYFQKLDLLKTPLGVLKTKGYVTPMTKKMLAYAGYPQTAEGEAQYFIDFLKKRYPDMDSSEAKKIVERDVI